MNTSASAANLSSPRYGYDMVVATTQASLNATMARFLGDLDAPEVVRCYVADAQGNPVEIDYELLKSHAGGADPFAIPADADPATDASLQKLMDADFLVAFRAKIGAPPGVAADAMPEVVTLGSQTSAVTYRLLCSAFSVVQLKAVPRGRELGWSWLSRSQPDGAPWVFESRVDLRLTPVASTQYGQLPPAVQRQISNLGAGLFGVQQLLFDLDNAQLAATFPTIDGVDASSPIMQVLTHYFLGTYFAAQKAAGAPMLGFVVQPSSGPASGSLTPTGLNINVSPLVGDDGSPLAAPSAAQRELTALNYLIMTAGRPLPPAAPFTWNWIEPAEAAEHDGVMAIRRGAFADQYRDTVARLAWQACLVPSVRVWLTGIFKQNCHFSTQMTNLPGPLGVATPTSGPDILTLSYDSGTAEDGAGLGDDMGKLKLRCTYDVKVSVVGNTMTVVQHHVIYLYVRSLQTAEDGNVVDRTLTDVYTLGVDAGGQFTVASASSEVDNSRDLATDGFTDLFTGENGILGDIRGWARAASASTLHPFPVDAIQSFWFPGGETFAFKAPFFSDNQDLVAHITYLAPAAAHGLPEAPEATSNELPVDPPADAGRNDAGAANLSSPRYGYDLVVATTQESINATMKAFLADLGEPEVVQCWVTDDDGNPQAIDYEALKANAGGADPFAIAADADPATDKALQALMDANFLVAFKARIGLPSGLDPLAVPDIITLGSQTSAVTYRLLCSEFAVAELTSYARGRKLLWKWQRMVQPDDEPWVFESKVDLRLEDVSSAQYSGLPEPVKRQIKNLGAEMFSVQQLLFDLDNAQLSSTLPTITGVDPASNTHEVLTKYFLGTYFAAQKNAGQPMLGCVIHQPTTDRATLHPTALDFAVSPMVDEQGQVLAEPTPPQQDMATLAYLMMTDARVLPPAVPFTWNWVDATQEADFHGVMAVNRGTFAAHYRDQFADQVRQCCLVPSVRVWMDGIECNYETSFGVVDAAPALTIPETGKTILLLNYASEQVEDEAGLGGDMGGAKLKSTFDLTVDVDGDTVTVTRRLTVYLYLRSLQTHKAGNVVDKTITDVYTLGVDAAGQLTSTSASTPTDASVHLSTDGFTNVFTGLNSLLDSFSAWARQLADVVVQPMPLDEFKSFVFPGGRTFAFKDVGFSRNQDLIAHLTYLDPASTSPHGLPQEGGPKRGGSKGDGAEEGGSAHGLPAEPAVKPPPPRVASKIDASTELMPSFLPAELIAPQKTFAAVQTTAGHSLLFSIGSDDHCYAIVEDTAAATGWSRLDIGAALLAAHGADASVRTFAVQQNHDATIDLVLVVAAAAGDVLYTSTRNSASDTAWLSAVAWQEQRYDDNDHARAGLVIRDVYLLADQAADLFVVDVDGGAGALFRYFVDPTRASGKAWNPRDLAGNVDQVIQCCMGHTRSAGSAGAYTLGAFQQAPVLLFTPLHQRFNPRIPANPTRLTAPAGATALAVSAAGAGQTDLWIAGADGLHYFASDAQDSDAAGVLVHQSDMFADITALHAWADERSAVIWALNRQQQIFYLTCERARLTDARAWSRPLPLVAGVERVTPYVNRVDGGRTFFAALGAKLRKGMQAPGTSLWSFQDILLPPAAATTHAYDAFTTRLHVADEQNQPVGGAPVQLSADRRVPVYVNGRYYVLDRAPITIAADTFGGLTVVEAATSLAAALLTATLADGTSLRVDPMAKHVDKLAKLNTVDELRAAKIQYSNKKLAPKNLVAPGTPDAAKGALGEVISNLAALRAKLPDDAASAPTAATSPHDLPPLAAVPHAAITVLARKQQRVSGYSGRATHVNAMAHGLDLSGTSHSFFDALEVLAGDLIEYVKSVWHSVEDAAISLVQAADDAWHFIVQIAEKSYYFVIDCAQKVGHALELAFLAIKTAFDDLIDYLKFLFDWDDFVRTRDAFKQVFHVFYQGFVKDILSAKEAVNKGIGDAKKRIEDWAGVAPDRWTPQPEFHMPASAGTTNASPTGALTGPAMFLFDHVLRYIVQVKVKTNPDSDPKARSLLDILVGVWNDERSVVDDAVSRVQDVLTSGEVTTLPLVELVKRFLAIVTEGVLNGGQVLIDAVLDVIVSIAEKLLEILEAEISFPIVNAILEHFGLPDFSFSVLDLVCMIGAIPATLIYKAARDEAPFTQEQVARLQAIHDREGIRALLNPPADRPEASAHGLPTSIPEDSSYAVPVFVTCKTIAWLATWLGAAPEGLEAMTEDGQGAGTWGLFCTAAGVVAGIADFIAGRSPDRLGIEDEAMSILDTTVSVITLVGKLGLTLGPKIFAKGEPTVADTCALVCMGFEAVMGVLSLIPTAYHFYELSNDEPSRDRSVVIMDCTIGTLDAIGKITKFAGAIDEEEISKAILVGVTVGIDIIKGALYLAQVFVVAAK